ncbi:hypothetical protein TSOC_001249 [Tetrabaena socialis]|uniref:DOMON domain-containing protein n=1 Tax=Tetrabaena socialis TaxID=47790 RepID=A0A2J8AH69_9CHLO|nr:hypothetical protein TSOC_001249 [Tetrabaena socialis]|eukprot:PNH11867.1 hypothetical protein TSOC_001249 [Tetrabaena socialis]
MHRRMQHARAVRMADDLMRDGSLHIAVQASVAGYVALGFATNPGVMSPADVVLGWASSSSSSYVHTFHVTDEALDESNLNEGADGSSWAYDRGVTQGSNGITTICFSRRLRDARATVSPDLRAATGAVGGGASAGGRRRLQQDVAATLGLNWAVSNNKGLVQHTTRNSGGFRLDVSSGAAGDVASSNTQHWINVHGVLMAVAWGLLLPLGTLLPAHRWILGDTKAGGKHVWFLLHLGFQWTGILVFVAGFVVAFVKLDDLDMGGEVRARRR